MTSDFYSVVQPIEELLHQKYVSGVELLEAYRVYLKTYALPEARLVNKERFERFRRVFEYVSRHNSHEESYRLRLPPFADATEEEIASRFGGGLYVTSLRHLTDSNAPVWDWLFKYDSISSTSKDPSQRLLNETINWAGTDNPLGAPITGRIYNQGSCGACWAFVAAAMVEAAANQALGVVTVPNLSAQALVDCDNHINRGCGGGNPTLALQYVARHGLVASSEWPYMERVGQCPSDWGNTTRYYISGVNPIPARNEQAIMTALRHGPVSIGVCGTDDDFLYYGSGIYDPPTCCSLQNHAMLVVGVGYDRKSNRNYWIAQNSWSEYWGERGFMRIAWTHQADSPGICGAYLNAVAAIGGTVVGNVPSSVSTSKLYLDSFQEWWATENQYIGSGVIAGIILLVIFTTVSKFVVCWRRRAYQSVPDH